MLIKLFPRTFLYEEIDFFCTNAALTFHVGTLFQQNDTSFSLMSVCKDGNETNKQFGFGLRSQMCIMSHIQMHFTPVTFLAGEDKSWGKPNSNLLIVKKTEPDSLMRCMMGQQ